ncbi:MAG: hypothetical protein V4543_02070 [Bacteroidota bacterium]
MNPFLQYLKNAAYLFIYNIFLTGFIISVLIWALSFDSAGSREDGSNVILYCVSVAVLCLCAKFFIRYKLRPAAFPGSYKRPEIQVDHKNAKIIGYVILMAVSVILIGLTAFMGLIICSSSHMTEERLYSVFSYVLPVMVISFSAFLSLIQYAFVKIKQIA